MIEEAENVLKDLGFYDVRVRHHELGAPETVTTPKSTANVISIPGISSLPSPSRVVRHLARIEVGPVELPRFLANGCSTQIAAALKKIGYAHVTLDLEGYRRGSMNEVK
jgi:uncharacterized protein